jgi:hypothetical protein
MSGRRYRHAVSKESDREPSHQGQGESWIWRREQFTRTGRLAVALTLLPAVIPLLYFALQWLNVEGPWGRFTLVVLLLSFPAGIELSRWTRSPKRR